MDLDNATIRLLLSFYRDETEIVETIENALDNDRAIQFHVCYDQYILGDLYIKGDQHKYVPREDAVCQAEEKAFLVDECCVYRNWGEPIVFFQQMIENCCRFPGRGWIGYQTGRYRLEIVCDQGNANGA